MDTRDAHTVSGTGVSRAWSRLQGAVRTDVCRQRRRITVVLMTACVCLICVGVLVYGARHGLFDARGVALLAPACLVTPALFLLVMRSGFNLRFSNPSLALPQAICAQTLVAMAYAVTGPAHPGTLILLATVMVFGIGGGLAGYCPGPAEVSLAWGGVKPLMFVGAMIAGMALYELLEKRR